MRFRLHNFVRPAYIILTVIVLLGMTSLPAAAHREFSSALEIVLVSAPPRQVKACQTFKVTYGIRNPGPFNAANVSLFINIPDPFEVIHVSEVPVNMRPGKYALVTAVIKVVAFVPGESRQAWVRAYVTSDPHKGDGLGPIPGKNEIITPIRLISEPVNSCP